MCPEARSETREGMMKWKERTEETGARVRLGALYTVAVCVLECVREMDRVWPVCINSLPDWLRLSGNVTREPGPDLIAIREPPQCI